MATCTAALSVIVTFLIAAIAHQINLHLTFLIVVVRHKRGARLCQFHFSNQITAPLVRRRRTAHRAQETDRTRENPRRDAIGMELVPTRCCCQSFDGHQLFETDRAVHLLGLHGRFDATRLRKAVTLDPVDTCTIPMQAYVAQRAALGAP